MLTIGTAISYVHCKLNQYFNLFMEVVWQLEGFSFDELFESFALITERGRDFKQGIGVVVVSGNGATSSNNPLLM